MFSIFLNFVEISVMTPINFCFYHVHTILEAVNVVVRPLQMSYHMINVFSTSLILKKWQEVISKKNLKRQKKHKRKLKLNS